MPTLLVLGSKPDPVLPDLAQIDAVACANASGRSARDLGLPDPALTVMTAVLTSGNPSDEHSFQQLRGLRTGLLYHLGRPKAEQGGLLARLVRRWKMRHMAPAHMRERLAALDYRYERLIVWPASAYHELMLGLCQNDPGIAQLMGAKQPSTGLTTLAVGMELGRWDRFVLAGFDFTLAHAYGHNPLVEERGETVSKHADTDIGILRRLSALRGDLFTTEPAVVERAGLPLLR